MSCLLAMPLLIQKQVEIRNLKLRLLHVAIQIIAFSLVLARFITAKQWLRPLSIGGFMSGEIWVNPVTAERLHGVWEEKSSSEVCASPWQADFQWDPAGSVVYANHTCVPPCSFAQTSDCIPNLQTHRRETQSQVFFVTQFEEHQVDANGLDGPKRMSFVPLEAAHSVGFGFHFSVPEPSVWGAYMHVGIGHQPTSHHGSSSLNVLTVIQDWQRTVIDVIPPDPWNTAINLNVTELLILAGARDYLDQPNPEMPNYLANAHFPEGGFGRITGLNIDLNVECFQEQDRTVSLGEKDVEWDGPVCYVRIEQSSTKKWATAEVSGSGDGWDSFVRVEHGIRVAFRLGGQFRFFDLEYLIVQVTSSIVFLFLPQKIMFALICHALGHLSIIYRDALIEKFDIGKEIARFTARLLATGVSFIQLEDESCSSCGADGDSATGNQMSGVISKARLEEQMREILRKRHSVLDDGEIHGLVNFCFVSCIAINAFFKRQAWWQTVRDDTQTIADIALGRPSSKLSKTGDPSAKHGGVIDVDCFSMCCASSDLLEFDSFVTLFDASRPTRLLERMFTPHCLMNLHSFGQLNTASNPKEPPQIFIGNTLQGEDFAGAGVSPTMPESLPSLPSGTSSRRTPISGHLADLRDNKNQVKTLLRATTHINDFDHKIGGWSQRIENLELKLDHDGGVIARRLEEVVREVSGRLDAMDRGMHRREEERLGEVHPTGTPGCSPPPVRPLEALSEISSVLRRLDDVEARLGSGPSARDASAAPEEQAVAVPSWANEVLQSVGSQSARSVERAGSARRLRQQLSNAALSGVSSASGSPLAPERPLFQLGPGNPFFDRVTKQGESDGSEYRSFSSREHIPAEDRQRT